MNVADLIKLLSECPSDAPVVFSPPPGCDSDTDIERVLIEGGMVVLTTEDEASTRSENR